MNNIFFDWSGTIKDAFSAHHWVVNNIFKKLGRNEITDFELKKEWTEPYMNFFNKYFPSMTIDEEKDLYSLFVLDPNYPKSKPIDGMIEAVNELKNKGNRLFLVTSDIKKSVDRELFEYKLGNVFENVYTEVYDKSVPIFELIKSEKLEIGKTYIVGDSVNEIIVSKKTGIKSIAVTWGFSLKEKLEIENPDFIINSPDEILNILN